MGNVFGKIVISGPAASAIDFSPLLRKGIGPTFPRMARKKAAARIADILASFILYCIDVPPPKIFKARRIMV